jgi:hypothetical protein
MRRHPGRLPSGPEPVSAAPLAIESFLELDLRDPPGRVQVDRLTPRAALEAEASRYRVSPRGPRQGHPALIEQARETHHILPATQFALTEQESGDFAKKGSRYA